MVFLRFNPLALLYAGFAAVMGWLGVTLPARFAAFGSNLIQGLIRGITGRLGALKATIVNAASSAANWFKSKLGIRSPSRVFMDLGRFVMEGLTGGLAGGQDGPVRRIEETARRMIGTAAGTSLPLPMQAYPSFGPPRQAGADVPAPEGRGSFLRLDTLSTQIMAALTIGAAAPAVAAPATSARAPVNAGAYSPSAGGDHYEIHIHTAAGQNEARLVQLLERKLEEIARRKASRSNSAFGDRPDWNDL
jgi:hypothetical protein